MNKKLDNAIQFIENCLSDYCENSLQSETSQQKRVNRYWQVILKELIDHQSQTEKLIVDLHAMTLNWIETEAMEARWNTPQCIDADWQRVMDENNVKLNFKKIWDNRKDQ